MNFFLKKKKKALLKRGLVLHDWDVGWDNFEDPLFMVATKWGASQNTSNQKGLFQRISPLK